jgi:hypothetical protein
MPVADVRGRTDRVGAASALDRGHPVYDCLYLTRARTHGRPIASMIGDAGPPAA